MKEQKTNNFRFSAGKLTIGILSIVLSMVITFQSCAVGLGNTLMENGSISGTAGFLLSVCWLVAGIVGIAARKSKGGCFTTAGFYIFAALMGFSASADFPDLQIWAFLSVIFAAIFIVSVVWKKKGV